MIRVLSPEETVARRRDLIAAISEALLEVGSNRHPQNFALYNALLKVFELWEEGEETRAELEVSSEKSCGCL